MTVVFYMPEELSSTSFVYPLKHQASGFMMFSVGTERGQWYEMRQSSY